MRVCWIAFRVKSPVLRDRRGGFGDNRKRIEEGDSPYFEFVKARRDSDRERTRSRCIDFRKELVAFLLGESMDKRVEMMQWYADYLDTLRDGAK